jgi:hypothetical protein
LRDYESLFSRPVKPFESLGMIPRNASPHEVHHPKGVLLFNDALFGSRANPFNGLCLNLRGALALLGPVCRFAGAEGKA